MTGDRENCVRGWGASSWVTMHCVALNVNSDLGYFYLIVPCGVRGKGVTSLNVELGRVTVDMEEVKQKLLKHFGALFDAKILNGKAGA